VEGAPEGLAGVTSVQAESAGLLSRAHFVGSKTTMQLSGAGASLGETLTSLSVQNTTLDDVFVHYTGRQLRDEQVKPVFTMPPRPGDAAMNRMFAIIEREMRKFFRSPTLMIMSLMMPILQLIIMGNAFGGKIVGAHVAVVDYDHGPQAVKMREAFDAVAANIKTFTTVEYTDECRRAKTCAPAKSTPRSSFPRSTRAASTRRTRPSSAWSSTTPTSSPRQPRSEMQSLVDA
jgi:hypothetical protein